MYLMDNCFLYFEKKLSNIRFHDVSLRIIIIAFDSMTLDSHAQDVQSHSFE